MKSQPTSHSIHSVLFDFDGTLSRLTLDFSVLQQRVDAVLARFAAVPDEPKYILEKIGIFCRQLAPDLAVQAESEAMQAIEDVEIEAAKASSLFPFVRPMLDELKAKGVGTAVVTRNCPAAIFTVFPDLLEYTDVVLTRDDVKNVKPHPEHLNTALTRLRCSAANALMVGDHPIDIRSGQVVGALTGAVTSGHSAEQDFDAVQPNFIAQDAAALMQLTGVLVHV